MDEIVVRLFLSTLSLRRATKFDFPVRRSPQISIHALLAESDRYLINTYHRIFGISIHALLAESDLLMLSMVVILI